MEITSGNNSEGDSSLVMPEKNIVNNRRQTFESYCVFASHFIAPVVGKQRYDNLCWQTTFSSYVSKSDEAFALLIFENNYDCWTSMAESNDWGTSVVKPAFTNGGNSIQTPKTASNTRKHNSNALVSAVPSFTSSSSRFQDWSAHGIKKFSKLFVLVEKEQMSSFGSQFEDNYLQHCNKVREQGKKKQNRTNVLYEVCRHEMWTTSTTDDCNYIKDDELEPDTNPSEGVMSHNSNNEGEQDDNASVGFEGFTFDKR